MMSEIKLCKPNGFGCWLKLYRLYLEAFPAEERKPFGMILKMYRQGKTDIWWIETDRAFSGLAITINGTKAILLDYFAVEKRRRGEGIGSGALRAIRRQYADKGLFIEIESTRERAPNLSQRQRRKRFYLSCGMEEMGTTAELFGVRMELLGNGCKLNYDQYKAFYRDNYNQWAADHIRP